MKLFRWRSWSTHWRFLDDTSCMIDSKKRGLLQILPQVLVLYVCSVSICAHTISSSCSLCALSFWFSPLVFCVPLLFFMCALSLSLFVRTPYLHMGSALHFDHSQVCPSCSLCALSIWFDTLVFCVLSLFGLPLLFFVCFLFLVCPCCSLGALSFWFSPLVLCALYFLFAPLVYVLSLFVYSPSLLIYSALHFDHSEIFLGLHIVVCGLLLEQDVTSASSPSSLFFVLCERAYPLSRFLYFPLHLQMP